ncbi:hypothetical protein KSS87_002785 [Heliosperma pusillum]|nr:hypothetical protein KSS87_002785 [Heliosperma pusillum]
MVVFTHVMADYTSPIAASRLFQAFWVDDYIFMPKALPGFIKSVDILQGCSGTVGSLKQLNFPDGRPFKYAINRVDEIDASKFYVRYTTIEGGVLRDTLESAVYEIKLEEVEDGTTHYTMVVHFHGKEGYVIKDEDIVAGKVTIKEMFDIGQQYLIARPQLYA